MANNKDKKKETSEYTGITGHELGEMLSSGNKMSEQKALNYISFCEAKYRKN